MSASLPAVLSAAADLATTPLGIAALAVAAGAFAQAATGMGFSLVAAPALIALAGPRDGVATTLALAVLASLVPLVRDARQVRAVAALPVLLPTLLATPVVAFALHGVATTWLSAAAGTGILAGVGLLLTGWRSPWLRSRVGAAATGTASALLNVIGGVGGPPVGLWAANADWPPRATRATLQGFFLVQNLVTIAVLGLVLPDVSLVVALVAGSLAGTLLAPRLSAQAGRLGVLVVSSAGGMVLLAGAF